jgi:hypothetical protein
MNKSLARILLAIVTIAWSGWSLLLFVGQTLGDCRDESCVVLRDTEIAVIWWRWLAIEIAAILVYLLNSRFRKS